MYVATEVLALLLSDSGVATIRLKRRHPETEGRGFKNVDCASAYVYRASMIWLERRLCRNIKLAEHLMLMP
jgi:hypothetical protein